MQTAVALQAAEIVRDAGGHVVGRTRLQKIAYLLTATGLETGFVFIYKHYGPYSEQLASAARQAHILGAIKEIEQQASWGGMYSTYTIDGHTSSDFSPRRELAEKAAHADAVDLELAATAVFLANEGYNTPWEETARRKPEKAENGGIERAKVLYRDLSSIKTPKPWPSI